MHGVQILTPDILSKVAQFHEGLHYYIARGVSTVYEAHRLLTKLGLNPHRFVKKPIFTERDWKGEQVVVNYSAYDFILEGTQDDQMPCNIAHYNDELNSLQFFVNKEAGTFGRFHGAKGYGWQCVAG